MSAVERLHDAIEVDAPIQSDYEAYRVGAHFLSPGGLRTVKYLPTQSLGMSVGTVINALPHVELAWLDLQEVRADPESTRSPLVTVGEPLLMTAYQSGRYEWAPLSQLIETPQLPAYTAEWLGRFLARASNTALTNSGRMRHTPFKALERKAPLAHLAIGPDAAGSYNALRRESNGERATRLAQAAIAAHPHLEGYYAGRGIV